MTSVRIGVSVRQPSLRLALSGPAKVTHGDSEFELNSGTYEIHIARPGTDPEWAARICTFTDINRARRVAEILEHFEVPVRLVEMGESLRWGDEDLDTTVTAVVAGRDTDQNTVLKLTRQRLEAIPVDAAPAVPGLRKYDDELARVEPVRANSPSGGDLHISEVEGEVSRTIPSPVRIEPIHKDDLFQLADVRIGIEFHWDHTETLAFRGALELVADGDRVTAVNEIDLDDYLASLLGSEMRPDWPVEALKAQAVAARSTVLATRKRHHWGEAFDLCHDDHCQCYQGARREGNTARQALEAVSGELLAYGNRVADARYAKISGIVTDAYPVAWDDEPIPYLIPVPTGPVNDEHGEAIRDILSRSGEQNLEAWLEDAPEWSAANPHTYPYPDSARDMESLFRWRERLPMAELSELIKLRTGRDLGIVSRLEPLMYGVSGRIVYLRVHGTNGTVTVGKELAIRRLLSSTHLPSSAFSIKHDREGVTIEGLGWGHGVGLCQLGAAGLANNGWDKMKILDLFYPATRIVIS